MSIALAKQEQGLLFSEPSFAETGVWCKLEESIDPAKWAKLCRHIVSLDSTEFERVAVMLMPKQRSAPIPILSIGPSKVGGIYQWEM